MMGMELGENSPVFGELINEVNPKVIIEVGSWKGASAIKMAKLAPQAKIYCIDTWLGCAKWMNTGVMKEDKEGHPTIFSKFIENTKGYNITPIPAVSMDGLIFLFNKKIIADLIYIDGCHYPIFVYLDAEYGFRLLRVGGVMFFDDYEGGWKKSVYEGIENFLSKHIGEVEVKEVGSKFIMRRIK